MANPRDQLGDKAFGGKGPLAGLVLDGNFLKGDFVPAGASWATLADIWGNDWLVIVADQHQQPVYDFTHMADADPNYAVSDKRAAHAKAGAIYKAGGNALSMWYGADDANMGDRGWQAPQLGDLFLPMPNASDGFKPYIGTLMHDLGTGADDTVRKRTPLVWGVPFLVPGATWDGPIYGVVNLWTRTAVLIGDGKSHFPGEALLSAIGATVLGVLQIVVGVVLAIAPGGQGGGAVLIASGALTIAGAWYGFAKLLEAEHNALASITASVNSLPSLRGAVAHPPGVFNLADVTRNKAARLGPSSSQPQKPALGAVGVGAGVLLVLLIAL